MTTEPIDIPISTSYDDEGAKDAIKDAEKLEGLKPIVEVDSDTSDAESALGDLTDSAQALVDRNPWIAEVLADTADAKADIEGIKDKLRETGDTADDTTKQIDRVGRGDGPKVGTQALADMLGPLGDVSGAASEAGQAVEGIGEFAAAAAAKVGLSGAAIESAVGGIGIAVGIAAAVWTTFKNKQEEARKKAAEHLKIQEDLLDAIKDGNRAVAASKFIELYGDIIDQGHKAGLATNEVVDFIRGTGDASKDAEAKIADLDDQIADLQSTYDDLTAAAQRTGQMTGDATAVGNKLNDLKSTRDALIENRDKWSELTDKQKANVDLQGDVQGALGDTEGSLDDTAAAAERAKQKADDLRQGFSDLRDGMNMKRTVEDLESDITTAMDNIALGVAPTKEEIRSIEDTITEVGEMAGKSPIEVKSEIDKIDHGDLFTVLNDAQSWANQHAIEVQFKMADDALSKIRSGFAKFGVTIPVIPTAGGSGSGSGSGRSVGAAPQVHVHMPGARASDVNRMQRQSARRNGRRYGSQPTTVQYARR